MATTTGGKTQFDIIWVSTSALRSCRRNAANPERVIIGRSTQVLSTCLRMREAWDDDREDSDENSRLKPTLIKALFIHPRTMKAHRSMPPTFKTAIQRLIRTNHTAWHRQLLPDRQHFPKFPGSINRSMWEIRRHRSTFHRSRVCWNMAETIKAISLMRAEVSSSKCLILFEP